MSKKGKTENRQVDAVKKKALSDVFDDGRTPPKKTYTPYSSYGNHGYDYGSGGYKDDYTYSDPYGGGAYQNDMFGRSTSSSATYRGGVVTSIDVVTDEFEANYNSIQNSIVMDERAVDVVEEYMLDEIQWQFEQMGVTLQQSNMLALGQAIRESLEDADVSIKRMGGKSFPIILKELDRD
jgi:hypothetical protein